MVRGILLVFLSVVLASVACSGCRFQNGDETGAPGDATSQDAVPAGDNAAEMDVPVGPSACEPCQIASDCWDGDPCTMDYCANGACIHKHLKPDRCYCTGDADCASNGSECAQAVCTPLYPGQTPTCTVFPVASVTGAPLPAGCCNDDAGCPAGTFCCVFGMSGQALGNCLPGTCVAPVNMRAKNCFFDADCDDESPCTIDWCEPATETCRNTWNGPIQVVCTNGAGVCSADCCRSDWDCSRVGAEWENDPAIVCDKSLSACLRPMVCPPGTTCGTTHTCEPCPGGVCKSAPCKPDCAGKQCGGGGCPGDNCGLCLQTQKCSDKGACVAP